VSKKSSKRADMSVRPGAKKNNNGGGERDMASCRIWPRLRRQNDELRGAKRWGFSHGSGVDSTSIACPTTIKKKRLGDGSSNAARCKGGKKAAPEAPYKGGS